MQRILFTILGVISICIIIHGNIKADSSDSSRPMTSCDATIDRDYLDGEKITILGRYNLGPRGTNDAPDIIYDISPCPIPGKGERAIIVDFSKLSNSVESSLLRK
jgi:hypothetical protein